MKAWSTSSSYRIIAANQADLGCVGKRGIRDPYLSIVHGTRQLMKDSAGDAFKT